VPLISSEIVDEPAVHISSMVELRLSFTPHAELRMEQRGVTEVDVRAMLERAAAFEQSVVEGRFMISVLRGSRPWTVIVEPIPRRNFSWSSRCMRSPND
jgi:hypothetical protein